MRREQLAVYEKCIPNLEKDNVIDIIRILYEAAQDINCLGVVFKRFDKLEEKRLRVETSEAEPLHVYAGEEEESVFFTYYASVVEDSLTMTDRQLKEVLNIMQQLELVKRFNLNKQDGKEEYLVELQQDTRDDYEESKQICAYALLPEAINLLKQYIQ